MPRFLWTKKQHIGPRPRLGHAMAFDSTRGCVVLFGGDTRRDEMLDDTWVWDGEYWTQVSDIGPSPRSWHSMAYDSQRRCAVLFGGVSQSGDLRRDTWEWDGEDWTEIADDGPPARQGHATVYDSARNRIILFGGRGPGNALFGDTWLWDGDAWTQANDAGPTPRSAASLAFDTVRNRVVLFGGEAGPQSLGDTWEWDGAAWTQAADFGPETRSHFAMCFKGDRTALFGGRASAGAAADRLFGNTWDWNGTHWTQRQDIGPGARCGHAMVFDSTRRHIVIFGGLAASLADLDVQDSLLSDTWEHSERGASETTPPGNDPTGRFESFTISPPSIRLGERATAILTLSAIPAQTLGVVLTSSVPLLFDPPVTTAVDDGVARTVLNFPAGTRQMTFRLRDRAGLALPPLPLLITITASMGASSLAATVTMTM